MAADQSLMMFSKNQDQSSLDHNIQKFHGDDQVKPDKNQGNRKA